MIPDPSRKHVEQKSKHPQRVSFSTTDKATRRVIAPYVKVKRKGLKMPEEEVVETPLNFFLERKPSILMRNLSGFLSDKIDLTGLLHETAEVLKVTTEATGVVLYSVDVVADEIIQTGRVQVSARHQATWKIQGGRTIATFVALNKEYVMVDDVCEDPRFPEGIGWKGPTVKSVICAPVMTPENECLAILELYRDAALLPFDLNNLRIVVTLLGWIGAAIHQNVQRLSLQRNQELTDYLINLTKCYFCNTVILNKIITEFVRLAKTTVSAEKGSFYIIDKDGEELSSDLYEEGIEALNPDEKAPMFKKKIKIKLGRELTIAGSVARTGETFNIQDAYNDPRFNKEIDSRTLSITRSVLCMPITSVGSIMGVIQVVNKTNGPSFTTADENILRTIGLYFSLVLHYEHLNTEKEKVSNMNQIYLNMLQFHMKPCKEDIKFLHENPLPDDIPEGFSEFKWYPTPDMENILPQFVLHMMLESIGPSITDLETIIEFILTVKKSYRKNPYHNFYHAFNVCHCIYNILIRNGDIFTPVETKALIIASFCHDIDHGGSTNTFLQIINDPLSHLYEDAPLEHHHFDVSMIILSSSQIFTGLDANTYRAIIAEIQSAILATDLGSYFRTRSRLLPLVSDYSFDWHNVRHRNLLKGIMMTAADLSHSCKPYQVSKLISEDLYREFYHQGDVEKAMGLLPLSMMDRDKHYMIADDQVQFISVVVLPCMEILNALLPNTVDLSHGCQELRDAWKEVIDMRGQKVWRPDESYVRNE